jgi:hypothetical protein
MQQVETRIGPRISLKETDSDIVHYPGEGAFTVRLEQQTKQPPFLKRVGLTTPSTQIATTNYGYYYTGPLYMGAARTAMKVMYDSGSQIVAVNVIGCAGCIGTMYDYSVD